MEQTPSPADRAPFTAPTIEPLGRLSVLTLQQSVPIGPDVFPVGPQVIPTTVERSSTVRG